MGNERMTITLTPRSMGRLAGWNLFISEYLHQGLAGGGDFQISMDYKEGKGLTMQLVSGEKKLRETHIKREVLEVAARTLEFAARFIIAEQRENRSPSILLKQNVRVSEGIITEEDSVEKAKRLIREHEESKQRGMKEFRARYKAASATEEKRILAQWSHSMVESRRELGAILETIAALNIMGNEEIEEYLTSLEADRRKKDGRKDLRICKERRPG